jgi:transposase
MRSRFLFAGCGARFVAGSSWSWSVHRSGARRLVERFGSKLLVEWLPAYAPDLNPVEQVWSHTKYADLANYIPDDVEALAYEVMDSLEQAGTRQQLLRSFFDHAELKL